MKITAIIQARLGSSRLPLKSLLTLAGSPLIDWVTDRVGRAKRITDFVVAIPDTPLDEVLLRHLKSRSIPVFSGPENDVLSRIAKAARTYDSDLIIRVCADNPLIWPEAIDRLVDFYLTHKYDYAYNHIPRGNLWPDGLGAEIISRELLEDLDKKATGPRQREHCLDYIWDNSSKFAIGTFDPREGWLKRPDIRLDIDTASDFARIALLPIFKEMDARDIMGSFG